MAEDVPVHRHVPLDGRTNRVEQTAIQVAAVFVVGGGAGAKPPQEFPDELAVTASRLFVPRDAEVDDANTIKRKQDRSQGEKNPPGGAETG